MTTNYNFKKQILLFFLLIASNFSIAQCWSKISAGHDHTIAIKNDGTLWAWGWNTSGLMGDGTINNKSIPTQIGVANNWLDVSEGETHVIALKTNGTLWAWGINSYGQLGTTGFGSYVPIQIGTATNWAKISSGQYHSIAICK